MGNDVEEIQKLTQENRLTFDLSLDEKNYPLGDVKIKEIETPVNKPTMRGGVYYADKRSYKLIGALYDVSVVSKLSKKMLGPNTEFEELKVIARPSSGEGKKFSIFTNLTNYMQSKSRIELNLTITRIE